MLLLSFAGGSTWASEPTSPIISHRFVADHLLSTIYPLYTQWHPCSHHSCFFPLNPDTPRVSAMTACGTAIAPSSPYCFSSLGTCAQCRNHSSSWSLFFFRPTNRSSHKSLHRPKPCDCTGQHIVLANRSPKRNSKIIDRPATLSIPENQRAAPQLYLLLLVIVKQRVRVAPCQA
jgi:hypothetical protein